MSAFDRTLHRTSKRCVSLRRNTDLTGDQRIHASPFENPIRVIWSGADPHQAGSKLECDLLKAAYFATFCDEY